MSIVKVTDREDIVKDLNSGAILAVNRAKADEYLIKKRQINNMKALQEEVDAIKSKLSEIDDLKNDLSEIKGLLKEIVNR